MLQRILQAESILMLLVKRELRARYAGSNLGALWNLVHPVVLIAIYVLIFSQLMADRMGTGASRFAYTIHLCAGMIPWFLFSEVVSRSSSVLIENGGLLKKMALPEEVLFLSVFITSMIVHGTSMLALMAILTAMGAPVSPFALFAFPVMVALGLAAVGIGMVLSVMTLLVRDVGQLITIALQIGFWSLPIVYVPSILPARIQEWIGLHPFRGFFALIQLLLGSPEARFNPDTYWMIVLLPFAAVLIGLSFLRSNRAEILDAL